jgi:hypothetical protein
VFSLARAPLQKRAVFELARLNTEAHFQIGAKRTAKPAQFYG